MLFHYHHDEVLKKERTPTTNNPDDQESTLKKFAGFESFGKVGIVKKMSYHRFYDSKTQSLHNKSHSEPFIILERE